MDITIRPATAADHAAFVRLFPALGVDDPLPAPERFAADIAPGMLVAESAAGVVGYLYMQTLRGVGYVRQVVVDAAARRLGLGERLMRRAAADLAAAGCARWCLNVKPDNAAALALYARLGLAVRYRSTVLRTPWAAARLPAPHAEVTVRAPTPDEERAAESAFALSPGLLADAGARPGRLVRNRG